MTINQLFRVSPSAELIYRYCQLFGLSGMRDRRWFSKVDMCSYSTVHKIKETVLNDLRSVYLKCKARTYLTDFDEKLAITVMRQLLKTQGYQVETRTVSVNGKRLVQYRLSCCTSPTPTPTPTPSSSAGPP